MQNKITSDEIEQLTFTNLCYEGLHNYQLGKKVVRSLVLSIDVSDNTDIMLYFEKFVNDVKSQFARANFEYILSCVNHQHIHCLAVYPFVDFAILSRIWQNITGRISQINVKFVKGDKSEKSEVQRLVDYISTQKAGHDTSDVRYFISPKWGFIPRNHHKKKEVEIISNINLPEGYQIIEKEKTTKKNKVKTLKQIAWELKHPIDI